MHMCDLLSVRHDQAKFEAEQRKKIRAWGLTAANLPYPRDEDEDM